MWWPVRICFHLLHPRYLVLHQELNNKTTFTPPYQKHFRGTGMMSCVNFMVKHGSTLTDKDAWDINVFTIPASSVLVLTETGLGSPTPTLFLAKTRNSYSTQALRSTTVAVNVLPSIVSGTGKKEELMFQQLPSNCSRNLKSRLIHNMTKD